MRRIEFLLLSILSAYGLPLAVRAQGDWAVYDTFSRYAPSVYSIRVEIPKQYILDRHEDLIKQFHDLQENLSDIVTGGTDTIDSQALYDNLMYQMESKLNMMRDHMLANNKVTGEGFAISPHHLVTLSSVVKSATVGGIISIKDDYHWLGQARLQGIDELAGIAVLTVKDVTFPYFVDLSQYLEQDPSNDRYMDRSSTPLPVASYIMTIQRPYELPASPFSGIIGGYNRLLGLFEIEKYIQTDLPLYPGNEGAPVFSPSGQLVGMIATEFHLGRWPGVTFVIPADIVADSALSILQTGKRERGWISGMGLGQDGDGICVEELVPKSPAALAGLQKGDIILGFDGLREKKVWNLIDYLYKSRPNEVIRFEVQRGSQIRFVEVHTSLRQDRK